MNNMKLFAHRVTVNHYCVSALILVVTGALNYLMWTYVPDSRVETLETFLLPYARPLITFGTVLLTAIIVFDPHTMRVKRRLAYFKR